MSRSVGIVLGLILASILTVIGLAFVNQRRMDPVPSPVNHEPSQSSPLSNSPPPAGSAGNQSAQIHQNSDLVLDDLAFVLIPEGSFVMGSPNDEPGRGDNERQSLAGIYDSFYLLKTEVTQAQFSKRMGFNPSPEMDCQLPVSNVTWDEADECCRRLSAAFPEFVFRMPTEIEWEYACRATMTTPFAVPAAKEADLLAALAKAKSGDEDHLTRFLKPFVHFGEGNAQHVAQAPSNAWRLHDMLGNVWEWCDGDPNPSEPDLKPIRGGAFSTTNIWGCRSAVRGAEFRDTRKTSIGFRVLAQPRRY